MSREEIGAVFHFFRTFHHHSIFIHNKNAQIAKVQQKKWRVELIVKILGLILSLKKYKTNFIANIIIIYYISLNLSQKR